MLDGTKLTWAHQQTAITAPSFPSELVTMLDVNRQLTWAHQQTAITAPSFPSEVVTMLDGTKLTWAHQQTAVTATNSLFP